MNLATRIAFRRGSSPSPLGGEGKFFPRPVREKVRVRVLIWFLPTFLLCVSSTLAGQSIVKSVDAVGMTVSDMDRSVEFFSKILSFEKVSDVEAAGSEYERLQSVFGAPMRGVRMKMSDEVIDLTEYPPPQRRPLPANPRTHDPPVQHICTVVR